MSWRAVGAIASIVLIQHLISRWASVPGRVSTRRFVLANGWTILKIQQYSTWGRARPSPVTIITKWREATRWRRLHRKPLSNSDINNEPYAASMAGKLAKSTLDDMRGSGDMVEWLKLLGHSLQASVLQWHKSFSKTRSQIEDLNGLNVIHLAGRKGQGSTCTSLPLSSRRMECQWIPTKGWTLYITSYDEYTWEDLHQQWANIERTFTTCLFEVWDKLPDHATLALNIPRYFQPLALSSFHLFNLKKTYVTINEFHTSEKYDATNVIRTSIVIVITSNAMNHVKLFNTSIENIAWHKAGILKSGVIAFLTLQESVVTTVLQ